MARPKPNNPGGGKMQSKTRMDKYGRELVGRPIDAMYNSGPAGGGGASRRPLPHGKDSLKDRPI